MSSIFDKIKQLKGKVTIKDIQDNIDLLADKIEELEGRIEEARNIADIDTDKGSAKISGAAYTLTCAALHKMLSIYKNQILVGGKCIQLNNELIMFPSLMVNSTGSGCVQITSRKISTSGVSDSKNLYYNPNNNTLGFTYNSPNDIQIAYLDWKRKQVLLNTTQDNLFFNPDTSPVISLTKKKFVDDQTINPPTNTPYFLLVQAGNAFDNQTGQVALDGKVILRKQNYSMSKTGTAYYYYCPVFIPPNLTTKYTSTGPCYRKCIRFKIVK